MHSPMAIQNLQAATPYQPLTSSTVSPKATSSTSSGGSNPMGASDLGSTFLSLLSQELQNQDPTDPVDSTAMVGQMISLNQLDQLISINQSLSQALSSPPSTTGASESRSPRAQNSAAQSAGAASQSDLSPAISQSNPLPFDPNTMMPWGFGNPGSSPTEVPAAAKGALSTTNNLNLNLKGRN